MFYKKAVLKNFAVSTGKHLCSGLDKFTFTHQIFRVHNFICAPDRAHKIKGRTKSKSMCMSDREKTRNNDFCSLLPKIGHVAFIFIVISPKSFAMRLLQC